MNADCTTLTRPRSCAQEEQSRRSYAELLRLAGVQRARWQGDNTMDTTALAHEAYLKLAGQDASRWSERSRFSSVAARAMRQVLIDYARAKKRKKRGGVRCTLIPLDQVEALIPAVRGIDVVQTTMILRLERALEQLERESPRHVRVVECRFFAGMTIHETARALNTSPTSVKRRWAFAQAWLYRRMTGKTGVTP